jgi:hypothetical protein
MKETKKLRIKNKYIDKVEGMYRAWADFWNGGEGYETYDDFVKECADNEFVKDNFAAFHKYGLERRNLETFIDLFSKIYPDSKIESASLLDNTDKWFTFIW